MKCVICQVPLNSDGGGQLLAKQVKAIFLLRQLLRLPPEKVSSFLERGCGEHLDSWVNLCGDCEGVVERAFELYQQQQSIHRKYRTLQLELVQKLRESCGDMGEEKDVVTAEATAFVRQNDYGALEDNPYLEGDREAQRRATSTSNESVILVKEEVETASGSDHLENSNSADLENSDTMDDDNDGECSSNIPEPPVPSRGRPPATDRRLLRAEEHEKFRDEATGRLKFRCGFPNCSRIYKNRHNFADHKLQHLENRLAIKDLPCDLCGNTFFGTQGITAHKLKALPELVSRPFSCTQCPLAFVSAEARRRHVLMKHQNIPPKPRNDNSRKKAAPRRQCLHCPYTTTTNSHLQSHVKEKHEGQRAFTCEHCGVGCCRDHVLLLHQAIFHSVCGVKGCGLRLENKEQLHGHEVTVHGKEVYVFRCDKCGEYLVGRKNFDRHQQLKHPQGEGERHVCELCGKSFGIERYLKYHLTYKHNQARKKKGDKSKE